MTPRASVPTERGQATVELALALPVIAFVLLGVLQVALVARDAVLVVHAAREAARAAAVERDPSAPARAAARAAALDPARLAVDVRRPVREGGPVRVVVRYRAPTDVPLVGALLRDIRLTTGASMRDETTERGQTLPPLRAFSRSPKGVAS